MHFGTLGRCGYRAEHADPTKYPTMSGDLPSVWTSPQLPAIPCPGNRSRRRGSTVPRRTLGVPTWSGTYQRHWQSQRLPIYRTSRAPRLGSGRSLGHDILPSSRYSRLNMAVITTASEDSAVVQAVKLLRNYWFLLLPLVLVVRFYYYKYASPLRSYPGPYLASGSRAWKGRNR